MTPTRRQWLKLSGYALAGLSGATPAVADRSRLGIVEHSFSIRFAADRARTGPDRITDPRNYLEHCARLGAGGIQLAIGARDASDIKALRERSEALGMYVEGSVRLPRDRADCDRFEAEIRTARESGATVVRTAALSGRRYETFASASAFREFADRAERSLTLAAPIVARHDVRLAVENHKDWRLEELVALLKRLDSRHVGACVDTGNSIALLEDPMSVVETLAPWAVSTHLKDMGVEEYQEGFLLSEVPLGDGFLDLPKIVATLRRANPAIRFSLEMITRDPLKVPFLTPRYWATLDELPARELARTLAMVRAHPPRQPLPKVSGLSLEEKLHREEAHITASIAYAREHLKL